MTKAVPPRRPLPSCSGLTGAGGWLTTAEACRRLACSRQYVDRLAREGRLVGCRDDAGRVRVDPASVDAWLAARPRAADDDRLGRLEAGLVELQRTTAEALDEVRKARAVYERRVETARATALELKAALAAHRDAERIRIDVQRLLLRALAGDQAAFSKLIDVGEAQDAALTQLLLPDVP